MPYRHGEYLMLHHLPGAIDAVESGEYKVVYMLRDPLERMKSLWRYMQEVSAERNPRAPQEWRDRQNADAARPFNEWLMESTELFNDGAHPASGAPAAHYATHFQVPAARKSAAHFLRGCKEFSVCRFGNDYDYKKHLDFEFSAMPHENGTAKFREANVTWGCYDFINQYHATDMLLKGCTG